MKTVTASGTRKRAIARATITDGKGAVRINKTLIDNYQPKMARLKIREPLILAGDVSDHVDVNLKIMGGGVISQADAGRLAIAKALVEYTKDDKLKQRFLEYDRTLLVADVRQREPRKPNTGGNARAKIQKSYR